MLAILGALVVLAGCFLPWYRVGGEPGGLSAIVDNGFEGIGIVSFIAALATLALVALPYAAGDRPIGADRGLAYALLTALALVGVLAWPIQFFNEPVPFFGELLAGLLPDRAPGWWISLAGVAILGRAAFQIVQEPARR
jgi:multidrug transporter EmrE-like cation transporter